MIGLKAANDTSASLANPSFDIMNDGRNA